MYFYGQGADGRAARQERGIGVDGAPFWGPSTVHTREGWTMGQERKIAF